VESLEREWAMAGNHKRVDRRKRKLEQHIISSNRTTHAIERLAERYPGLDFYKVRNFIFNCQCIKIERTKNEFLCYSKYLDNDIFFILNRRKEIATFLTREMIEKDYSQVFRDDGTVIPLENRKKKKKKKRGKPERKRKVDKVLIIEKDTVFTRVMENNLPHRFRIRGDHTIHERENYYKE
jgi:hypothetical protein